MTDGRSLPAPRRAAQRAFDVRLRRPVADDFDRVLELIQACDRAVYGGTDWTPEELRDQWDEIDLTTDAWVAELDGRLAGVVHLCDVRGGRIITDGYVHPELVEHGVGSALVDAVEERARDIAAQMPEGDPAFVETAHLVGDERAPRLLTDRGYRRARTFFRMTRSIEGELPEPEWPEGIVLRPFEVARHGAGVHAAFEIAFAGEWGHVERAYDAWADRVFGWRGFDPGLVVTAWEGDELAGFSLNYPKRMGDWGWIGSIGVVPGWRRRGLGEALLSESFHRFRDAGEAVVALGVDAENPTGATRLYERVGMTVLWRADVWRKDLRAGE